MRWFGEEPFAYACTVTEKCDTPVGDRCEYCRKAFTKDDKGFELPLANLAGTIETEVYYHQRCLMASVGVDR